jgi:ADP-ribose pyrophosphatase
MGSQPSNEAAWETLARREIYDASPFVRLNVERVRLPDGRIVEDFHRIEKPDYALVVPSFDDGRILLIRQYKHGVGRPGLYPPGGHMIEGESPLECVRRELIEETGYEAERWMNLGSYVVDANQGSGTAHFFRAKDLRQTTEPDAGDLEDMALVKLTPNEVCEAIRTGEVNVLGAVAALTLALDLNFGRMNTSP